MGLLSSSKSESSSISKKRLEDNRIAAEDSAITQVRGVRGDVTFSDQGAIASGVSLGESGLDLAGRALDRAFTVAEGQTAEGATLPALMRAAVPLAAVGLMAWAVLR